MTAASATAPNDYAVLGALRELLDGRAARVLDLGGGTGVYAVPLAGDGHDVRVLDNSNDALATLARRAQATGVADRVSGAVADLDALADAVAPGSSDVVLCHRVLEYVADPEATVRVAAGALARGGLLSIVAANRAGAVLGRVIAGRFEDAAGVLDGAASPQAGHRFDADGLRELVTRAGLQVTRVRGVGLVGELNPSAAGTAGGRRLDARLADEPVLAQVAPLIHLLAQRAEHGS